jgi:hypothetical protein
VADTVSKRDLLLLLGMTGFAGLAAGYGLGLGTGAALWMRPAETPLAQAPESPAPAAAQAPAPAVQPQAPAPAVVQAPPPKPIYPYPECEAVVAALPRHLHDPEGFEVVDWVCRQVNFETRMGNTFPTPGYVSIAVKVRARGPAGGKVLGVLYFNFKDGKLDTAGPQGDDGTPRSKVNRTGGG